MKMKTPVQMTDDLARFIKENREDAAYPHESLYVDLLEQWKVLSRYQLAYADKESKRLIMPTGTPWHGGMRFLITNEITC